MYSEKKKCKILNNFRKNLYVYLMNYCQNNQFWVKKKDSQFLQVFFVRWAMTGSNRRHFGCKPNALPAELIALTFITI